MRSVRKKGSGYFCSYFEMQGMKIVKIRILDYNWSEKLFSNRVANLGDGGGNKVKFKSRDKNWKPQKKVRKTIDLKI